MFHMRNTGIISLSHDQIIQYHKEKSRLLWECTDGLIHVLLYGYGFGEEVKSDLHGGDVRTSPNKNTK